LDTAKSLAHWHGSLWHRNIIPRDVISRKLSVPTRLSRAPDNACPTENYFLLPVRLALFVLSRQPKLTPKNVLEYFSSAARPWRFAPVD
jgi:hypothetical protein